MCVGALIVTQELYVSVTGDHSLCESLLIRYLQKTYFNKQLLRSKVLALIAWMGSLVPSKTSCIKHTQPVEVIDRLYTVHHLLHFQFKTSQEWNWRTTLTRENITENSISFNRIQRAPLTRYELPITQCTANRNIPVTGHKYLTARLLPAKPSPRSNSYSRITKNCMACSVRGRPPVNNASRGALETWELVRRSKQESVCTEGKLPGKTQWPASVMVTRNFTVS